MYRKPCCAWGFKKKQVIYSGQTPTCEAWTMMGTPRSLCPVSPMASGTEDDSTNSMYAIPFDLREFLSEIILTSLTYGEEHMARSVMVSALC